MHVLVLLTGYSPEQWFQGSVKTLWWCLVSQQTVHGGQLISQLLLHENLQILRCSDHIHVFVMPCPVTTGCALPMHHQLASSMLACNPGQGMLA